MTKRWAVKVIDREGEEDYICEGLTVHPKMFTAKSRAEKAAEFLREGVGDEYQSINVVPYPKA